MFADPRLIETEPVEVLQQLEVPLQGQGRILTAGVEWGEKDAERGGPAMSRLSVIRVSLSCLTNQYLSVLAWCPKRFERIAHTVDADDVGDEESTARSPRPSRAKVAANSCRPYAKAKRTSSSLTTAEKGSIWSVCMHTPTTTTLARGGAPAMIA